jgi:hypothetical protein
MKKNVKSFKELIEKYEHLVETLPEEWDEQLYCGATIMRNATGFGSRALCTLCLETVQLAPKDREEIEAGNNHICDCHLCLWKRDESSTYPCTVHETYHKIRDARNPEELKSALRDRIVEMKKRVKEYERKSNT